MEKKVVCIYHSRDLDGWMSGAIVKLKYPDAIMIGWDYGQPYPNLNQYALDADSNNELFSIIMVDVSFPMPLMESLLNQYGVTWIDHHASAINERRQYFTTGNPFKGLQFSDYAACELTWMYLFDGEHMPELVRLLGRYDCFGHKGTAEERRVLEFQYGARMIITDVTTALINLKMAVDFGEVVCTDIWKDGVAIYNYLCTEAKSSYKKIFPIVLDGYRFACINQERFNPINFGINYHNDGYDGFACFWYSGGKFTYSLYNDNGSVDCSVIAKNRGGGGHKGAAGFVTDEMINF